MRVGQAKLGRHAFSGQDSSRRANNLNILIATKVGLDRTQLESSSLPGAPTEAWFFLGEALWNDNSPAARTAYERYLELVPSGPLAERARRAIQ